MNQQQRLICGGKKYDVILDCHAIERNLFKVLKSLNDVGSLYLFSDPVQPQQQRKIDGGKEKVQHLYVVSQQQAVQIVWRSAYLTRQLGAGNQQSRRLFNNKLVGKSNQMSKIILDLELKMQKCNQISQQKLEEISQKLIKLKQIKTKIENIWQKVQIQPQAISSKLYSLPITLFGQSMSLQDKKIIQTFVKKRVLGIDLKMLQNSIMFIQEMNEGHCIVVMEQCYPSFMVYKELFKSMIGLQAYSQGLREVMLAKYDCYRRGTTFHPLKYAMCHICKTITMMGRERNNGFKCNLTQGKVDPQKTPLGYEQIRLFANYDCLFGGKGWNKLDNGPTKDFWKYSHPYSHNHSQNCNRYYCNKCLAQNFPTVSLNIQRQTDKKTDKQKILQNCLFCKMECQCQRCKWLIELNRVLGLYHAIGGNFQEILSQMMFSNWGSQKIFMQLVTFESETQMKDQKQETEPISIDDEELQMMTFSEQVQKLETIFLKKLHPEQIPTLIQEKNQVIQEHDSNKIFPNLQQLFDNLLISEASQNQQKEDKQKDRSVW